MIYLICFFGFLFVLGLGHIINDSFSKSNTKYMEIEKIKNERNKLIDSL